MISVPIPPCPLTNAGKIAILNNICKIWLSAEKGFTKARFPAREGAVSLRGAREAVLDAGPEPRINCGASLRYRVQEAWDFPVQFGWYHGELLRPMLWGGAFYFGRRIFLKILKG